MGMDPTRRSSSTNRRMCRLRTTKRAGTRDAADHYALGKQQAVVGSHLGFCHKAFSKRSPSADSPFHVLAENPVFGSQSKYTGHHAADLPSFGPPRVSAIKYAVSLCGSSGVNTNGMPLWSGVAM